MKEFIRLEGDCAHIRYTFTNTGKAHAARHQEMPAVFCDYDLGTLVYYSGKQPWTGGALTRVVPKNLSDGATNQYATRTEEWAAYVDSSDHGIGAYTPGTKDMTYYTFGHGPGGAAKPSCSYFAPIRTLAVTKDLNLVYDVYLTIGSLDQTNAGYRIDTPQRNEYFLLENRQPNKWDAQLPGHGMLVFRVDSTNVYMWYGNSVNDNPAHPYYELVRAGGTHSTIYGYTDGQSVSNLYLDNAGNTIASGYAVTGTTYYYTTDHGMSYQAATNVSYESFASTTLYKDADCTIAKTETKPQDGQAYYDANGKYCVILPQQTTGLYVINEATKVKCNSTDVAVAGMTYFDMFTKNNGVYYTKVIKVQ